MGADKPTKKNRQRSFLEVYKRTGRVGAACESLGIHRNTFQNWMNRDQKFKEIFERTNLDFIDAIEASMINQATKGNVDAGKFMLRAHKRERYAEKVQHEHSGEISIGHKIIGDWRQRFDPVGSPEQADGLLPGRSGGIPLVGADGDHSIGFPVQTDDGQGLRGEQ